MAFKVGLKRLFYQDPTRSNWEGTGPRPLVTDVWYPAAEDAVEADIFIGPPNFPLFKAGKAARDADFPSSPKSSPKTFPLILLSHGTGGASLQLGWLASYLSSRGYITAAVNHHGNNGLEPYAAKGFLHYWERPKDLKVLLDQLLSDPNFGAHIHPDQIGAAGFSLGGYTMLAVAGGRTNIQPMIHAFTEPGGDPARIIPPEFTDTAAFMEEFKSLGQHIAVADASYRDERIKAVFAIAPVLGETFSANGLSSIQIPVRIIVGDADQQAPPTVNSSHFVKHIKNAELTLLENVGHYTFLGEGTEGGRQELPMFCCDEGGVERASVHQLAGRLAEDFFGRHLGMI